MILILLSRLVGNFCMHFRWIAGVIALQICSSFANKRRLDVAKVF
jgi:hypothetical protein